jgi:Fur family ferric uptake transcriptional regulator
MVADIYEFDIKHHSLNMYGHCIREDCPNRSEATEEVPDDTTAKEAAAEKTDA